ncbi:MAG: efflux RND transporter periplasmic adaptor subunit [Magnetovibrio sp.]|nr:efflux RND transporter periplasmic adaptor subunit [Magnetovibrio sp.]
MSPKGEFNSSSETAQVTQKIKGAGMRLQSSHKTAIGILALAVVWMLSGVYKSDEAATASNDDGAAQAIEAETPPMRVRVALITSEEHVRKIAVLGRIEADKSVNVRAEIPGRVSEIIAIKGAQVAVGDVLVKLDPENMPALLAEARARMKQREIAYDAANKLSKGGYSSRLNVAQAKADMEAARAQVSGMRRNLNNTTIIAPIAGIVDDLPMERGDFIDKKGAIVARVIDLTTMIAVGEVTERNISSISLGAVAQVRLPDDRELNGTVSYIAKSTNAMTRTFRVEVTMAVPDQSVPEGVTAQIRLPMAQVVAHKISPALLTLNDNGVLGVKTVTLDDVVEFHEVKMIADTEDGIWLTGLPHEVQVITVGQEFVSAGQTVVPVQEALKTVDANGALQAEANETRLAGEGN